MEEVYEFLKQCGTYYLATEDGGQPRVRPFGTVDIFEGRLYIQTGKVKDVSKQLAKNPKAELCAMSSPSTWIRVQATLVEDDRAEARKHMLDAYPSLRRMYTEGRRQHRGALSQGRCRHHFLLRRAAQGDSVLTEKAISFMQKRPPRKAAAFSRAALI